MVELWPLSDLHWQPWARMRVVNERLAERRVRRTTPGRSASAWRHQDSESTDPEDDDGDEDDDEDEHERSSTSAGRGTRSGRARSETLQLRACGVLRSSIRVPLIPCCVRHVRSPTDRDTVRS